MSTLNWSTNGEYVFKLSDLRKMVENAPSTDDSVFISVCYANVKSDSGNKCEVQIQACTGTGSSKGPVMALGCPEPPGCP